MLGLTMHSHHPTPTPTPTQTQIWTKWVQIECSYSKNSTDFDYYKPLCKRKTNIPHNFYECLTILCCGSLVCKLPIWPRRLTSRKFIQGSVISCIHQFITDISITNHNTAIDRSGVIKHRTEMYAIFTEGEKGNFLLVMVILLAIELGPEGSRNEIVGQSRCLVNSYDG